MIDFIINLFSYTKLFISLCFFTYLYKYFYSICNEKKLIKIKNEKPKKVIKIRNTMSFIYFFMVLLLYIVLDWFTVFSILLIVGLVLLVLAQKFDKNLTNGIKKYDANPFIQKSWYVFSFLINFVLRLFSPCHRAIDRKVNINKEFIKNAMMNGFFENSMTNFDILTVFNNVDMLNDKQRGQTQRTYGPQDIPDKTIRQLTNENEQNMNEIEEFLKTINKKQYLTNR